MVSKFFKTETKVVESQHHLVNGSDIYHVCDSIDTGFKIIISGGGKMAN